MGNLPASPETRRHRARVAVLTRELGAEAPQVAEARDDLAAAKLEAHIRAVVDKAPPLSAGQRERLAVLLAPSADLEAPRRARHARQAPAGPVNARAS